MKEVDKLRILLATKDRTTLEENKGLLLRIGQYYRTTRPGQFEPDYVIETEKYLQDLYVKAQKEDVEPALTNKILTALGFAKEISYSMRAEKYDPEYYARVYPLGELLIDISQEIESRLAGDSSTDAPPPDVKKKKRNKK